MESRFNKNLNESLLKDASERLVKYKGFHVFSPFLPIADSVENFEVRDDDIWVCSFPRTGTTWTQEMVWAIAHDLDFEGAKLPLTERFPYLESSGQAFGTLKMNEILNSKLAETQLNSVEYTANMSSPRHIKTHLPFHLLPWQLRERKKKAKIIYITRNPKDTCVSNYYYRKLLVDSCETFERFCRLFLKDTLWCAPFWDHVNGYWERKNDENILCLKYEDMEQDLASVIKKTATFLGKQLDDTQVQVLEHHLSFTNMRNNPAVNREVYLKKHLASLMNDKSTINKVAFIREGRVEQWKSEMTNELIKEFDNWIDENVKRFPSLRDEF